MTHTKPTQNNAVLAIKNTMFVVAVGMICCLVPGSIVYVGLHSLVPHHAVIYWLIGVTLLFPGILLGVSHACERVLGYSNDVLFGNAEKRSEVGVVPIAIIQAGVFSMMTGLSMKAIPLVACLGSGLILGCGQTLIRRMPKGYRRQIAVVLSDILIGGLASGIVGGVPNVFIGGVIGGIVGVIEILMGFTSASDGTIHIFPVWVVAWLAGIVSVSTSRGAHDVIVGGAIVLLLAFFFGVFFEVIVLFIMQFMQQNVSLLMFPLLILSYNKTILCNRCLCYTRPLKSRYEHGRRHCEHCSQEVERTRDPGKILVTFGNIRLNVTGRVFMLTSPEFDFPYEVSYVYLDPKTCDPYLLERFVVYLHNSLPVRSLQTIRFLYQGTLDDLEDEIRNMLRNRFQHIEALPPENHQPSRTGAAAAAELVQCAANPHHFYMPTPTQCPWCERGTLLRDKKPIAEETFEKLPEKSPVPLVPVNFRVLAAAAGIIWGFAFIRGSDPVRQYMTSSRLRNERAYVSVKAANTLGERGSFWAVDPLITALTDQDADVQKTAADALGKIGSRQAVDPLIATLIDEALEVRKAAAHALDALGWLADSESERVVYCIAQQAWEECVKIGLPAVEPLIAVLMDENSDVRKGAAHALGTIGSQRAIEPLMAALNDKAWFVREAAAHALGAIGAKQAVESLIGILTDKDSDVRKAAAHALDALGWLADSESEKVVYSIAQQKWDKCVKIGQPAIGALIVVLADENSAIREAAAQGLSAIGQPAVEPLITALKNENSDIRKGAAHVLGTIGAQRVVEPLITVLNDKVWFVRETAAHALVAIDQPIVEPLLAALLDQDDFGREAAAYALGKIGDSRAVEPLMAVLNDKVWFIRAAAARTLQAIGDTRTVESLSADLSDLAGQQFAFEVVTVDARGETRWREKRTAHQSLEDLGNGVILEMVYIPGGTFLMGAPETEEGSSNDERPQHTVMLTPFFMSKFPVTQAQWEAVMGAHPSSFKGAKRPVEDVSWNEAIAFCRRLSKKTGHTYRLPSEAEWEYACRVGTTTPFYFGKTITTDLANYDGNDPYAAGPKGISRKQTTDVGSFPPNAFGLYDMHGNVREWCQDRYDSDYYSKSPGENPYGPGQSSLSDRVVRGGGVGDDARLCRAASRAKGYSSWKKGFRLVRTP